MRQGVSAGDVVVTEGVDNLQPGAKVATGPPGGAPSASPGEGGAGRPAGAGGRSVGGGRRPGTP